MKIGWSILVPVVAFNWWKGNKQLGLSFPYWQILKDTYLNIWSPEY